MDSTWNEIHRLVQQADQLDADGRLTIFEFLAQIFSLIPLRDGFPTPAEIEEHGSLAKAAKKYKLRPKKVGIGGVARSAPLTERISAPTARV